MNINIIDPLSDSRWDDLVACHPKSSAFHQRGWIEALARTYGYEPIALTTAAEGEPLTDGMVLCRVSSWITGTRMVSLPFADHCEPLLDDAGQLHEFINWLRVACEREHWRYVELRPMSRLQDPGCLLEHSGSYYFHQLDLSPKLERILGKLHKDSIQRRIRRAEKERLAYEVGRSEQLLNDFYRLMVRTRRRHGLLPQPRQWFRDLIQCMGDKVQIRLAKKDGLPVAAMFNLLHRSTVIYKYGCSDERFHHFGIMPFLFWRLIEESKASGAEQIDFGRSDREHQSLISFKDKFGTRRESLTYYRYPVSETRKMSASWTFHMGQRLFPVLPDAVLSTAGGILYRHLG